jgi:hypothetical protein
MEKGVRPPQGRRQSQQSPLLADVREHDMRQFCRPQDRLVRILDVVPILLIGIADPITMAPRAQVADAKDLYPEEDVKRETSD